MVTVSRLFCIYDSKADGYNVPFVSPNAGTAQRMFSMNVNEAGTMINSHPEDFVLFEIATFNSETCELVACVPKAVCNGVDVIKRSE